MCKDIYNYTHWDPLNYPTGSQIIISKIRCVNDLINHALSKINYVHAGITVWPERPSGFGADGRSDSGLTSCGQKGITDALFRAHPRSVPGT